MTATFSSVRSRDNTLTMTINIEQAQIKYCIILLRRTRKQRNPKTKGESNSQNEAGIDIVMDITRDSSLFKTIQGTAFTLRFEANYKIPKSQRKPDQLTTS